MLFQSTLRRTERRFSYFQQVKQFKFQSTLRRTERPYKIPLISDEEDFNPRSDERSDDILLYLPYLPQLFQSTLRRTERQNSHILIDVGLYFNPRSDERSDVYAMACIACKITFQSTLRRTERQQFCTKKSKILYKTA